VVPFCLKNEYPFKAGGTYSKILGDLAKPTPRDEKTLKSMSSRYQGSLYGQWYKAGVYDNLAESRYTFLLALFRHMTRKESNLRAANRLYRISRPEPPALMKSRDPTPPGAASVASTPKTVTRQSVGSLPGTSGSGKK